MRKRKKENWESRSDKYGARENNVRLSVTTYSQVPRNGDGGEVKSDVIGRSKNTRISVVVVAAFFEI